MKMLKDRHNPLEVRTQAMSSDFSPAVQHKSGQGREERKTMKSKISTNDFKRIGRPGFAVIAMLLLAVLGFNEAHAQSTARQNSTVAASNVAGALANGQQAQQTLLIDSFKVGPYATPLVATTGTKIQTGDPRELLGGSRQTFFQINKNPDTQPVSLQVLTARPALIVSTGYDIFPLLQLGYKVPPVSADLLSKYDRFLIDFDGLDHGLDLIIVVYGDDKKVDGHSGEVCKVLAPDGPFTLSFPFARLAAPEVLKHTNTLVFSFQPTSGGLDYSITRISSAKGDPTGKRIVTCAK
jgi:hypothetical protein